MDKYIEKSVISALEKEIIAFIKEWQRSPFMWNRERDIQVELASRLKSALIKTKIGNKLKPFDYGCVRLKGFKKEQPCSRLCCEEVTYYKSKNKKRKRIIKSCYPDIIVYNDLDGCVGPDGLPYKANNPPGKNSKVNWPMLLVCEIKYESESYGDFHPDHRKLDRKKLQRLIKQQPDRNINGTKYACFLNFKRIKKVSNANIYPTLLKKGKVVDFVSDIKESAILPLRRRHRK